MKIQTKRQEEIGVNRSHFLILVLGVALGGFWPVGGRAEITLIYHPVMLSETIRDNGQVVSQLMVNDSGLETITAVTVNLVMSSGSADNPMWLGDLYSTLTFGTASESERVAVLLNRPGVSIVDAWGSSLGSLNVTLDDSGGASNIYGVTTGTGTYQSDGRLGVNPYGPGMAYEAGDRNSGLSALQGAWLGSNLFQLLVADTQSGGSARLDQWGLSITGTTGVGTLGLSSGSQLVVNSEGALNNKVTVAGTTSMSGTGTIAGDISGTGSIKIEGGGTLHLSGSNTYLGDTTVDGGTLIVDAGGSISESKVIVATLAKLKVNGLVGAVDLDGDLSGSGSVGDLKMKSGSSLNPGNSPGTLSAASATWAGGATYSWEIANALGVAGIDWDLFLVTGTLDLSSLSAANQLNLVLHSLTMTNYDPLQTYSWKIVQADSFIGTGLVAGTDVTQLFAINGLDFNGGLQPEEGFKVITDIKDGYAALFLQAVPEPSAVSLLAIGLGGLAILRRRRS